MVLPTSAAPYGSALEAGQEDDQPDFEGVVIGGPSCFWCLTDPGSDDTDPEDVEPAVTQVDGTAVCRRHAVMVRQRHGGIR